MTKAQEMLEAFEALLSDLQTAWGDCGGRHQVGHGDLCLLEEVHEVLAAQSAGEPPTLPDSAHVEWSDEDYRIARDCMIGLLRGHGWTISEGSRGVGEFDNAFQHAVGILALRAGGLAQAAPDLRELLLEASLQIDYLHKKFQPTGTGEATLARIRSALSSTPQRAPFDLGAYIDDNTDDGR